MRRRTTRIDPASPNDRGDGWWATLGGRFRLFGGSRRRGGSGSRPAPARCRTSMCAACPSPHRSAEPSGVWAVVDRCRRWPR